MRQFKIFFYLVIGISVLIMILPTFLLEFTEFSLAIKWTVNFFVLPILIVMIPSCSFIYLKFIKQHETKNYTTQIQTTLRSIFRIFFMTLGMTFIFSGTVVSFIILSNAYFEGSKSIDISGKIIDYSLGSRNNKHYIEIKDNQFERIIKLQVQQPYEIGQTFEKRMYIGKWGLLFLKK